MRKFSGIGTFTHIDDGSGLLQTQTADGEFAIELQNSDRFSVGIDQQLRAADAAVRHPAVGENSGRRVPASRSARVTYLFGQQRPLSGTLSVEHGGFYDGHRTSATFNRTRVNLSPRFSLEPNVSINWIDLPTGAFTTTLVGSRVTYTMTPLMFASALVQYNSSTNRASTNVRLRWEYRPGSELFVVYNDEHDTFLQRFPNLQNRAFIVKVTRLFRF